MLNELYKLKGSLETCRILAPQIHSWIQNAGKKEGLILYINDKGIDSLDYVDRRAMGTYWKITKDFHHSFPVFKLDTPIYKTELSANKIKKICDERDILELTRVINNSKFAYDNIVNKKGKKSDKKWDDLTGRYFKYPNEINETVIKNCPKSILSILITRLINLHNKNDKEWFVKQLSEIILSALQKGNLKEWSIVESVFFGSWDKKKKEYKKDSISLVLDIADYIQVGHQVSDEKTKNDINSVLLKIANSENKAKRKDAFGNMQEIEGDKFPSPYLPVLGPTYLFSMFEEAECHWRYKRISSKIIPVGKNLLTELNSALLFVVDSKRKGKTWQKIPSNKGKQSDLLISYLENKPDNNIEIAGLFSEGTEDENAVASFEQTSSTICRALEGIKTDIPEYIQLIVLSKIDPGRKQIVLSERYETTRVKTSVDDWNNGAKNHPEIYLYKEKERIYPKSLSPAEVTKIFHSQWIRNGLDRSDVIGIPLCEVYNVFLGEDKIAEKTAEKLLRLIIQRNSALLIGVGGAIWSENWKEYRDKSKEAFLKVVSIISILLWKIKIKKEVYMNHAPFSVGRMLALADTLHREYCINVRAKSKSEEDKKKSVPPSLIGNSLMAVALNNPERGLAQLSKRLLIYQAWAQTAQGEGVGLAKWVLSELGEVSNQLKELTIPKTAGDTEKAQILLGYLARTKSSDENK